MTINVLFQWILKGINRYIISLKSDIVETNYENTLNELSQKGLLK